jgi:hypothetical protein
LKGEIGVNIPAWIADIATAIGVFLLFWQLCLSRRDQKGQAIACLFDELVTPEFRKKLQFVYSRQAEDLVLPLPESERDIVEEVLARFDGLGFRVRNKLVPKQEALHLFWDLVIRSAQQLYLHVQDQRARRGPQHEYKEDYEWLLEECKRYQLAKAGKKLPREKLDLDDLVKLDPLPIFNAASQSDAAPDNV